MREEQAQSENVMIASQYHSHILTRRHFQMMKVNCGLLKRRREWISFKKHRRERFFKLLSFLYLKQECVMSKHIKQLQIQNMQTLKSHCFRAFKQFLSLQLQIGRAHV